MQCSDELPVGNASVTFNLIITDLTLLRVDDTTVLTQQPCPIQKCIFLTVTRTWKDDVRSRDLPCDAGASPLTASRIIVPAFASQMDSIFSSFPHATIYNFLNSPTIPSWQTIGFLTLPWEWEILCSCWAHTLGISPARQLIHRLPSHVLEYRMASQVQAGRCNLTAVRIAKSRAGSYAAFAAAWSAK